MRKRPESDCFNWQLRLKDVKRRLCRCAVFACMLLLPGIVLGQEQKVTLNFKDAQVQDVLKEINRQTGLDFVYNLTQLQEINPVTVQVENVTVDEALKMLLEGTGFEHRYELGSIVIRRKGTSPEPQNLKQLNGHVTDRQGNPLPWATVIVKGTTIGVVTDTEGRFTLAVPADNAGELVVSYVGMRTATVKGQEGKDMHIVLDMDSEQMDEVVITGYQVIDKKKSTVSNTVLKMDDIMVQGAASLDQMLEGRVPGMVLMSNSGEVGVVPKIRIRGTSTLVGNREPLWVVDGIIVQDPVPISAEELNDPDYINRIGNAIAGLNPQDIERIDILKDAAATALYGVKAANGVIVITTKKGRVGPPLITYNMTTTFRQRPRYTDRNINLMNSKERVQFSRELNEQHYVFEGAINYVGYEGLLHQLYSHEINDDQFNAEVAKLETENTDWFKLLTGDSFSHQHTVSISGGSEETRYYASIGFTRDNDVIKDNHNQRYTAVLNLESSLTDWLYASFQLQGNVSERRYYQDGLAPIDYAYNTSRTIPAYDDEHDYFYYNRLITGSSNVTRKFNILNELENSYQDQHTSGLTVTANLRFNFTPWLNANAILSYTNSNAEIEGYWGEKTFHAAELRGAEYGEAVPSNSLMPYGGELSHNETRSNTYTFRFQANANKYFGTHEQHNINASAGFEMNSTKYVGYTRSDRGYYPDRGKQFMANINIEEYPDYGDWLSRNVPVLSDELTNILSGYATVAYSYRNLFTVSANARVDGSNRFGDQSNDKFLPIWSLSANYNIADHEFFKRDWLNYFTFKFSFGYQGNMLDSESPVLLINKLPMDSYYNEMEAEVSTYPNPNLKWEKTSSLNAGLTFALLDNRIQMETEYYYKHTKNAFMTKKVATMNGVNSYTINGGDIENQGYSVSLTAIPIRNNDWNWVLSTSFSRDYNKVNSDPSSQTYEYTEFLNGTALVEGKAVNTFYSYEFLGLNPVDGGPMFNDYEDQKYELYGLDKYHTITKVLKPSGRREPYMSGSLTTSLRYKNWRLNAAFPYSLGAKTRLFRMFDKSLSPENNVHRDFLNRWKEPGDEKHTNIPALLSYSSNSYWNYMGHYSAGMFEDIETFATSAWEMYDYSDIRVVSANYLKCSSLSLTYEFDQKLLERTSLSRVAITLSGTNLFTICSSKLNGQTPTQGGFSEIQLSDRPTYSLGLSVSF